MRRSLVPIENANHFVRGNLGRTKHKLSRIGLGACGRDYDLRPQYPPSNTFLDICYWLGALRSSQPPEERVHCVARLEILCQHVVGTDPVASSAAVSMPGNAWHALTGSPSSLTSLWSFAVNIVDTRSHLRKRGRLLA